MAVVFLIISTTRVLGAENHIDRLEKAIAASGRLAISIESEINSVDQPKDFAYPPGRRLTKIWFCSQQEKVATEILEGGLSEQGHYKQEYLIDANGKALQLGALFDSKGKQVPPTKHGGPDLMMVLSDKKLAGSNEPVNDVLRLHATLEESGAPVWVVGWSRLMDYFQGNVIKEDVTADGASLSAEGILGKVRVELSKEHGWLPRSFTVEKNANSKVGKYTVRTFYNVPAVTEDVQVIDPVEAAEKKPPPVEIQKMSWAGRVIEFSQTSDGIWYPSKMSLEHQVQFSGGKLNTTTSRINIKLLTDAELTPCDQPSFSVPVGYPVSIDGASHLPYRWDGKGVVPGIPNSPPRANRSEIPTVGKTRPYLIAANVVVVLAIVAFLLWKRFSQNR